MSDDAVSAGSAGSAPGDLRFFGRSGPFSVAELVACAELDAAAHDPHRRFVRVAPLQIAGPDDVSFLDNRKYLSALEATKAGAVIVHPAMADKVPSGTVALVTRQPYLAWAKIAALFHPLPPLIPGVHPTAVIDPTAAIDPGCEIGPFVLIGSHVKIAAGCRIGAHSVIGDGAVLGADCRIGAHSVISHAVLGARVITFPGVRIGQDGFGFATTMTATGPLHVSVPQLGKVVIENDVEIGANTCIDRGSAQDTMIGAGTRLDNLVQIGHNVRIGRACVIVAQVGIAGSSVLEDFVVLAGQVGVAGHVRIGRGARVAGQTGVMSDLAAGTEYMGSPAMPAKTYLRQVATLKRLSDSSLRGHTARNTSTQTQPKAASDDETGRN